MDVGTSECLEDGVVVGLAEGTLDADSAQRARAHLENCETCSMLVAQASRLASEDRNVLGRYLVHDELGAGGMGRVLRAYDPRLGRDVALKILLAPDQASASRRLLREARALALLNHPNVVTVYDVHRAGDEVFVAMELIDGVNLRTWLAHERPLSEILTNFANAGAGLHASHRAGIAHRDFKPSNVMIEATGRVVVVDYGLATQPTPHASGHSQESITAQSPRVSADSLSTTSGIAMGTPRYMAPEQYQGTASERADQYQFCLALLEGITGRWPFEQTSSTDLAAAKSAERFAPDAFKGVPRRLQRALRRGLRANPDDRWPDMLAILGAIAPAHGRRTLWLAGGSVAAISVAAAAFFLRPAGASVCDDPQSRLDETWGDERSQSLRAAFEATGVEHAVELFDRIETALDAHAEAWIDAYQRTCATDDADSRLFDAKMRCLNRARAEVHALVGTFEEIERSGLSRSVQAVAGLAPIERCLDETWVLTNATVPADPIVAAKVEDLEGELSEARALTLAGRFEQALVILESAVERSRAVGHEPLIVHALSLHTACLRALDRPEAIGVGEEAYLAARLLGDDRTAWKIASDVATAYRRNGEYADAQRWLDDNEEVVQRLRDPLAEATFYSAVGVLALDQREVDRALEANTTAVELLSQVAPKSREYGVAVRRLGSTLRVMKRLDEARARLEESRAVLVASGGAHDPELRIVYFELGNAALAEQKFEDAVAPFERALEMITVSQGTASQAAIETRGALSQVYRGAGRLDDAQRVLREGLALAENAGLSRRTRALMLRELAGIHQERGDPVQAARRFDEALRIAQSMEDSGIRDVVVGSIAERAAALHEEHGEHERAQALRLLIKVPAETG